MYVSVLLPPQHVLQAIKHRVEAEVQTRDQPFVRLLAACLRQEAPLHGSSSSRRECYRRHPQG